MSTHGTTDNSRLEFHGVSETRDSQFCITFIMKREDHTLGNSLRYIILNWNNVDFCGYSVPHPSVKQINLRIQSNTTTPFFILQHGFVYLRAISEVILDKFKF
eukprot:TRINITY_DN3241_c0_g4_i1.p1 TRINITY_DN3241_c0_g4~~TRINITY_DN3241_c0_g4_i1.p1  ORF type:complete len:103 (+),score=0.56 TRINITY_DN3241_c0_g4_i1:121-429(+)